MYRTDVPLQNTKCYTITSVQWADKWQMAFNTGNANFKLLHTTYIVATIYNE